MNKNNNYHLFLFLTTFTRGLVETFSLVLLYKKGFMVKEILIFLLITYLVGIVANYVSLKIKYKTVLIISSILYGISYLYFSFMRNSFIELIVFAILLGFSNYSYHCIRHYLALSFKVKNTSLVVNVMFLGIIVASIIGTFIVSKLSVFLISIILFILSFISLFPIFKLNINDSNFSSRRKIKISKRKVLFNVLEQFRVIFIELQPLFLYLYVNDSIIYVGWFNIIINISSLIVLVFLRKVLIDKYYFLVCILLGGVLLFKISVSNVIMLFIVAILEGILIKLYERGSLNVLYNIKDNNIRDYLLIEELIFFGTKSIFMLIFLLWNIKLISILFICIVGIIISGFIYKENM